MKSRRLEYGKYKTAKIDVTKNIGCANAANYESLKVFGYQLGGG